MAKAIKNHSNRGKVEEIRLQKSITFNGNIITKAIIEIDHVNFGLDKNGLKKNKRTNFSVKDIEKFIMLLDGENIIASKYKGKVSQFDIRITCPVKGKFYGKEFLMFFDTDYNTPEKRYTITLYPGW